MFKWVSLIIKAGRLVYDIVDEIIVENRNNEELKAKARRIQSQRYIEASHRAGHEHEVPKK